MTIVLCALYVRVLGQHKIRMDGIGAVVSITTGLREPGSRYIYSPLVDFNHRISNYLGGSHIKTKNRPIYQNRS